MLDPMNPTDKAPHASCQSPDADKGQPPCVFFCIGGKIPPSKFIWMKSNVLASYEKIGPP